MSMIYFASPYSSKDPEIRILRYEQTCLKVAELTASGMIVISPVVYGHTLETWHTMPLDWEFWENFCTSFLRKCDEIWVYMLPGWEESEGIAKEIELAKSLNLKVNYIQYAL